MRRHTLRALALVLVVTVPSIVVAMGCARASEERAPEGPTMANDADVELDADAGDATTDTCGVDGAACMAPCDAGSWCPITGAVAARYVLTSVWGSGPSDVWAAGSGGTIVHWDGSGWTTTPSGTLETLNAVWGTGKDDVYAVSTRARILHSTGFNDGTANWSLSADAPKWEGLPMRMRTIWGPSRDEIWVGGDYIFLYDYDLGIETSNFNQWRKVDVDGGIGWDGIPYIVPGTIRCIWGFGANDIWVLADNGGFVGPWGPGAPYGMTYHFAMAPDGGAAEWREIASQTSSGLKAVWGSGPSDVWSVGARGTIRHFGAGSRSWDVVASPTMENLNAVWAIAPDDAWIVGDGGTILHYDGKEWTPAKLSLPAGSKPDLYGVWGSGPNDVWAVGDGVVLHYVGQEAK